MLGLLDASSRSMRTSKKTRMMNWSKLEAGHGNFGFGAWISSQTFEGQLDHCSVNANLILRDQKKFEGAEQPERELVGTERKNEGRCGLIGTDTVNAKLPWESSIDFSCCLKSFNWTVTSGEGSGRGWRIRDSALELRKAPSQGWRIGDLV